jgi:hypothetical protein
MTRRRTEPTPQRVAQLAGMSWGELQRHLDDVHADELAAHLESEEVQRALRERDEQEQAP